MLVDEKCIELARHFCGDPDVAATEQDIWELADVIQCAVEDWIRLRHASGK